MSESESDAPRPSIHAVKKGGRATRRMTGYIAAAGIMGVTISVAGSLVMVIGVMASLIGAQTVWNIVITATKRFSKQEAFEMITACIGMYYVIDTWTNVQHINKLVVLFAILVGMAVGDFLSGVAHYALDTYDIPGLERFNTNFRKHHTNPLSLENFSMNETLFEVTPVTTPIVYLNAVACRRLNDSGPCNEIAGFVYITVAIASVFASMAQINHRMAHRRNHNMHVPTFVKFLQDNGVILHPDHHRKHHATEVTNYCISNGMASDVLDMTIERLRRPFKQYANTGSNLTQITYKQRDKVLGKYKADDIGRPYRLF